jgi:H+/Cl- antiporter ClcA
VLFGVELGIFIAVYSHFYVRKPLDKHVTKLMDGLYVNRYKQAVLGFLVSFLVLFLIITLKYAFVVASFKPSYKQLY